MIYPFINFSDWIIVWFVLYKLDIIKYNPKIFILFGIIDNIIGLTIEMSKPNKNKIKDNIGFIIHFAIKILMFYLSRNTAYTVNDFNGGVLFFIIYSIYLYAVYNLSIIDVKFTNIIK